jgi:hypothetical protein
MRLVTLYKTPSPGTSIKSGEYYELALDNPDGGDFILKEYHGNWDEVQGRTIPGSTGIPIGHYPSSEEGNAAFDKQKLFRAKQGFQHSLRPIFNPQTLAQEGIYEFVDVGEEI